MYVKKYNPSSMSRKRALFLIHAFSNDYLLGNNLQGSAAFSFVQPLNANKSRIHNNRKLAYSTTRPVKGEDTIETDVESETELQKALRRAFEKDMGLSATADTNSSKSIRRENDAWYAHDDYQGSLPFDCTSCGKCCKTKGNVIMSPSEVNAAASLLGLSLKDFTKMYASHKAPHSKERPDEFWLKIRSDETSGCIFLKDNLCSIYEARPSQCSTYPFWTSIMDSSESWNKEVRQSDDSTVGPYWTAENGGCEGMSYTFDHKSTNNASSSVSIYNAVHELSVYERSKAAAPQQHKFEPV